ncbi:MAG: prolyl oligopeptidase family serine peptidase [Bdellovibrionota bacterium]
MNFVRGFNNCFLILLCFVVFLSACQSKPKSSKVEFKYSEFEKVVLPKGELMPLPGANESLLLVNLPEDKYPKLYRLHHATQTFKVELDFGRPINYSARDHLFKRYFLLVDQNGDENFQIYTYDLKTKKTTNLFGKKGFQAAPVGFSKDADRMYIRSNHEDKKIFSVYRLNLITKEIEKLTDGKISWDDITVDPEERYLTLSQSIGNNENHLTLFNLKTKKSHLLFKKPGTNFENAFFDPKKPIFYLNSNDDRDRTGCASVAYLEKEPKLVWLKTDDKKDISCYYEQSSRITKMVEQFDGQIKIRLLDGIFGQELATPIPDKVIASQFSVLRKDGYAFVRLVSSNNPGNYYRFKLADGAKAELETISQMNLSQIHAQEFAESFDITYKSFDGMPIHGIIYAKEEWLTQPIKRPLIVWPHGGPDSLEQHRFHPFFQYWVLNGYVVFAPNFRGSTGYGKKFETMNDKDWGGGHIKDLVWGRREMTKLPYIDSKRTFIVGASFGGYSTLSTITQYPKEFKAAVAMVALANLFTFYKSIPPDPAWQNEFLMEMGNPITDADLYKERSPFYSADRIRIPLKIYQAENDIRTVKAEMDEFVNQAQLSGHKVEYEVLKDEGHHFGRTETWEKVLQGTIDFLNQY